MTVDRMKLVKFVCVAKAHAGGRSESALTVHEGAWAFCPMGGDQKGHEWRPSDGLPLTEVLRFTPRQQAPGPLTSAPATPAKPEPPPTNPGKAKRR
jgi:hypothetical protein